ncbi:MAG: hypothetical protein ABS81_04915 [Pseudonocardia sp. SCN 72-86]|nr:MAG: hypothetical protein ABS81_04915 [Pseudonocardia sp. SCN 72-86]
MSANAPERHQSVAEVELVEQILIYLRISEDRTGEEAGVDRQRADCLGLCARLGLSVTRRRI